MSDQDTRNKFSPLKGKDEDQSMQDCCKSNIETENVCINDILCFISTAINSKTDEFIIQSCFSFYETTKIKHAKSLLCSLYGDRPKTRRGDGAKRAEIGDIIDLFRKSEENNISLPKFVAGSFDSLPPGSGYEVIAPFIIDLIDQVKSLKGEIEIIKNLKTLKNIETSLLDELRNDVSEIKCSIKLMKSNSSKICNSKSRTSTNNFKNDSLSVIENRFLSPITHSNSEYKVISQNVLNDDEMPSASKLLSEIFNNKEESTSFDTYEPTAPPLSQELGGLFNDSENRLPDVDGPPSVSECPPKELCDGTFAEVLSRTPVSNKDKINGQESLKYKPKSCQNNRRSSGSVKGIKQVTGTQFRSAKKYLDVYIGNCDTDIDPVIVKNYVLKYINVNVAECQVINANNFKKSFKITVLSTDRDKLLDPSVWPKGIICRKFYKLSKKSVWFNSNN